jgi:hypothetical protein
VVLLLTVNSTYGRPCNESDGFGAFFSRFTGEEQFRDERIVFPLHALVGSPSEGQSKERWSKEQLAASFNVPVLSQHLEKEGLREETRRLSPKEVEVEQFIPEADSYNVTYRFKLKRGCWYLVHYEYSSY